MIADGNRVAGDCNWLGLLLPLLFMSAWSAKFNGEVFGVTNAWLWWWGRFGEDDGKGADLNEDEGGVGDKDLLVKTVANGGEGGAVLALLFSSNGSRSSRYLFLFIEESLWTNGCNKLDVGMLLLIWAETILIIPKIENECGFLWLIWLSIQVIMNIYQTTKGQKKN